MNLTGFVGAAIEREAQRLYLYWNGPLPGEVSTLIAGSGLDVDVRQVPYPLDVLDSEAHRIASQYPDVVGTGIGPDFKSLTVKVNKSASPESLSRAARITSTAPAGDSIPIAFSEGEPARPADRQSDAPPFWGGSRIADFPTDTGCSTGFTAKTNNTQTLGIVTAAHCGSAQWRTSDNSRLIGYSQRSSLATDSQFLTGGASYGPAILTGPWNSSTGRTVGYWSGPMLGQQNCDGGGWSGETCGAFVISANTYITVPGFGTIGPGYWSDWTDDSYALAGEGDSGGTSFTLITGKGQTLAQINGIIIATDPVYTTRCRGPFWNRHCSGRVFHVYVESILGSLGITPLAIVL